jgi:hypothetical protein
MLRGLRDGLVKIGVAMAGGQSDPTAGLSIRPETGQLANSLSVRFQVGIVRTHLDAWRAANAAPLVAAVSLAAQG